MSLLMLKLPVFPFSDNGIRSNYRQTFPARGFSSISTSVITVRCCCLNNSTSLQKQSSIRRIRERIENGKVEISPSAYDTAWVAMVPVEEYSGGVVVSRQPCFPECLDWIIENQNSDGSWGLDPGHPSLVKDSLSCTLACVLALRKWNVGHQQLNKGLEYIRANSWAARDKDQHSPIGFDVIFPTMVDHANQLGLSLPFDQDLLDSMIQVRDSQIKSETLCLGYVAEGVGESFNWDKLVSAQQRSNGSLFNSPATTAAALIHGKDHNNKCFEYLQSLLKIFKNWVPTVYPLDVYTRVCLVDTIKRLGIDRYFQSEIDAILEETYRLWQQKEEEIFADISCCAMAFRLLRVEGFEVSSDELAPYADQDHVINQQTTSVSTILELYRASYKRIHEDETTLDSINDWTTKFLKEQLVSNNIHDKKLQKQVEFELRNFNGILDPIVARRTLDQYSVDSYQILKTAYRCPTIYNEDFLAFSRREFNVSQAQYQKELEELERWYKDCRLDKLKYGRDPLRIAHFLVSGSFYDPERSDARLCNAQTVILVTRIDDFFDHYGSREDSHKILELIKEWKEKPTEEYGSEEVEILFTAIYNTVNDLAERASLQQGRCVRHIFIGVWVELMISHMKELDTYFESDDAKIMTVDEYLSSFGWMSIACRVCILPIIQFLGVKVTEEMVTSSECTDLCIYVSIVDRLLNDLQTFQKEKEERKLNAVSIMMGAHGKDEETAISEIRKMIEHNWRKAWELDYKRGTVIPRKCKDVFLETSKTGFYLYSSSGGDEFTSPQQLMDDMRLLIHQPLD